MKWRHNSIKVIGVLFSSIRVSVSRAIKPFGEPDRPPEWFSQKVRSIYTIALIFVFVLDIRKIHFRKCVCELLRNVHHYLTGQ